MRVLVHHGGQQWGPFDVEELQRALAEGRFQSTDLAWHDGLPSWVPLGSLLSAPALSPDVMKPGTPTSGLAVASLALGAGSTFFCILAGIPAIVCGHLARAEIRRAAGKLNGDGMAVAGLVLGYLSVAMVVAFALFFLLFAGAIGLSLPHVSQATELSSAPQYLTNASAQVFRACKAFAVDNGGRFPETLEELVPFYLQDRQLLSCPLTPREEVGYFYYGGTDTDAPSDPLLMSKGVDTNGMHLVIRKDGSVTLRRADSASSGAIVRQSSRTSAVAARNESVR